MTAKVPGNVGDHGWGGAASTYYWVDPVNDLSVVFMTQLLPSSALPLRSQLKQLVRERMNLMPFEDWLRKEAQMRMFG